MARKQRLIRHGSKIAYRQKIEFPEIRPGMIINFSYKKMDVFDKFPLILVLQRESIRGGASGLLHGLNLNYMYDSRISFMKTLLEKFAPITESKNVGSKKLRRPFNQFGFSSTYRGINSTKNIFNKVIGPRILKTDDCYRSYQELKMKNMYVCMYDFDGRPKEYNDN